MTELFEKSLNNLQFDAVLHMLAGEAVSEKAKQDALELRPGTDEESIRVLLDQCTAARYMIGLYGSPSFSGVKDVTAPMKRAEMGGVLSTRELLTVAGVLRSAREVQSYGDGEAQGKEHIDFLFSRLTPDRALEERIANSIVSEEEIADSASVELSNIRRLTRAANSRIREVLQKIITSTHYASVLQEPIITTRGGRYVVPVKAEFKGAVSGLVHDISQTGATVFIEPMQVVQANNEIRELAAREKAEIERILAELTAMCDSRRENILTDYDALTALDLIFAKAKLSYRMNAMAPGIAPAGHGLIFRGARHPLIDGKKVVPIDVELGESFDTLVITGPNTGGKTVALKTIGLLTVMAQAGLHIPVNDGSQVRIFDKVLSDIGDEQSIEQSLSTFSAHMKNIIDIMGEADGGSLILFDELGAGTDPVEGAALAIAVIENLRSWGCCIAATTHYAELKVFATATKGVANASCEFDVKTLRPTYRLLIGLPGKSNAFAISRRLGLDESVIKKAREHMDSSSTAFEEVIQELDAARQDMEKAKAEAAKALREAEMLKAQAAELREKTEQIRQKAEEKAKAEAQHIIDETRAMSDSVMAEMKELRKQSRKSENWQQINEQRAELRRRINEAESQLAFQRPQDDEVSSRKIRVGDTVKLKKLGTKAEVVSIGKDGELNLLAGAMKITAKENEVLLLEEEKPKKSARVTPQKTERQLRTLGVSGELDLRGMMTDEAVDVLQRYLDTAMLANLNTVTIIHGKGTGALRQAVHNTLKRSKQVKSFRLGRYGEGENGVTVVELK